MVGRREKDRERKKGWWEEGRKTARGRRDGWKKGERQREKGRKGEVLRGGLSHNVILTKMLSRMKFQGNRRLGWRQTRVTAYKTLSQIITVCHILQAYDS